MSNKSDNYYLKIDKRTLGRLSGDPASMLWYAALKDYARRFKPDREGYIRISPKVVEVDYGFNRDQIKYLNKKLRSVGLIEIDPVKRGRRIPTGYKIY